MNVDFLWGKMWGGGNPIHIIIIQSISYKTVLNPTSELLQQSATQGVEWLDGVRHMLQGYNSTDRHTIPITGNLFEG